MRARIAGGKCRTIFQANGKVTISPWKYTSQEQATRDKIAKSLWQMRKDNKR